MSMEEGESTQRESKEEAASGLEHVIPVSGMFRDWFLDYASYVILERAVPALEDGLKPVQRRILHSMKELDDGRYHKVANLIGNTMKYHPHGDASIGDALVQLGQKDLLIDTQGNWGNVLTGDSAAAPRYIEARLTKFALEVAFNPKTTLWTSSYDGRGKEPVHLPVKFPSLLAQGADGIAVGLSTKILPHNFIELIDASIKVLKGKTPLIFPDFITGGMADFTQYNDGKRGGRIRVRARISVKDTKTLTITEIPFGTTTSSLIDSIIKANEKGKIKIKKIEDNTSSVAEILVYLPPGVSPDKMIDALYAFTDCEVSISPNACVIENDKPRFMSVSEMLIHSTKHTVKLLKQEQEIRLRELQEMWHFASLERIFIENRIYHHIEECETWDAVMHTIHKELKPYVKQLHRPVTDEDVSRLTEIRIKRITRFDINKAEKHIENLSAEIDETKHHLKHITEFAISYFKNLKKKYGKGKERKTEIKIFDTIQRSKVAAANVKLYVNREEGFVGYGLKRLESEFICDCSDIDDIITIRENGKMCITRISDKFFAGRGIIHAGIWKKNDARTIYNLIYQDGKGGRTLAKRFAVTSITRDKEYDLTKGKPGTKILYLSSNPNGEAEIVNVFLRAKPKLKKLKFEFNFADLAIKGRSAFGNTLTKHIVRKIEKKTEGVSTLSARKIWFDETVQRLNTDERGLFLGSFSGDDKILVISQSGTYQLTGFDLFTKFDNDVILIEKWNPEKPISAVYYNGRKKQFYIKRFLIEKTSRKIHFITDDRNSFLEVVSTDFRPVFQIHFAKDKNTLRAPQKIPVDEFIDIKGVKAIGNQLSRYKVKGVDMLDPLPPKKKQEEGPRQEGPNLQAEIREEKKSKSQLKTSLKPSEPNENQSPLEESAPTAADMKRKEKKRISVLQESKSIHRKKAYPDEKGQTKLEF